jgi:phytoene synthase
LYTIGGGTPPAPRCSGIAGIVREHGLPLQLFARPPRRLLRRTSSSTATPAFPEVSDYCRRSANPVGRLLLHLFGRATPENLAASDSVCSALQLVNFWQDVELDYAKGRIYLPRTRCKLRGNGAAHPRAPVRRAVARVDRVPGRARARHAAIRRPARARAAGTHRPGNPGDGAGGLRILDKLERAKCDMFRQRPVLEWFDWPLLLARAL